ncbi:hypothetical protein BDZ89DRAFT_1132547 [Hymenopellis radicata]|nr:hypothetical protein BDZ89DRAFT_1132547 [Hymenopellis radicata]
MPEFTVLKKFEKEARLHASDMGSSGLPASNPAEYGRLGVFPDTLARPSGARQSVTIHSPPPKDPYFLPIAKPRNTQKKKNSSHLEMPPGYIELQEKGTSTVASICYELYWGIWDGTRRVPHLHVYNCKTRDPSCFHHLLTTVFPPTTISSGSLDSTSNSLPSAPFFTHLFDALVGGLFSVTNEPLSRSPRLPSHLTSSGADFISTWTPLSFTTPWDDVRGHAPPRPALLNGFALILVVLWSVSRLRNDDFTPHCTLNAVLFRKQTGMLKKRRAPTALAIFSSAASALEFTKCIRICFGLEGHLLWIPTKEFDEMTSVPAAQRASIQLFFRRPDWTLIVLDHNVMISFHVMRLHHVCTQDDLQPGSAIWNYIWSKSHGPVWHLEPEAMLRALRAWRETIIENEDMTAVFVAVKGNQAVNNGYGAQETTDMLWMARIHPCMPIYCIATNSELWDHFVHTHREYQLGRLHMLVTTQLANVSGDGAFRFNEDAHIRFLRTVPIYRRATVRLERDTFLSVVEQNLLNPKATLCDNGTASLIQEHDNDTPFYQPALEPPVQIAHIRPGTQTKQVPIYRLAIPRVPGSSKKVNVYTPITAKIPTSWGVTIQSFLEMLPEEDILKVQHKTTLGPYSFDLFVAAVWSADRVENLPATKRTPVIYGKSVPVGEEQLEEEEEEEDEEEDKEDKELSSDDEEA